MRLRSGVYVYLMYIQPGYGSAVQKLFNSPSRLSSTDGALVHPLLFRILLGLCVGDPSLADVLHDPSLQPHRAPDALNARCRLLPPRLFVDHDHAFAHLHP